MKPLRLGIIGTCGRGVLADLSHTSAEDVNIVAGADASKEMQERFRRRYLDQHAHNVAVYSNYREMVDQEMLDGVFIASPDFLHEEQACYCLSKGVAVYLEKPMAITIEGCDRILEAAYRHGAKLMLGHNMRYMAFTNKMKSLIDSGVIGDVQAIWCRHFISYGGDAYFRDWHAEQSKATSLLLQKGAHDIDIIHWLAGSYSVRVSGMGRLSVYDTLPRRVADSTPETAFNPRHWPPKSQSGFNPIMDVEDHSMILMQLGNGIQACYMQCHYTPDSFRNYTIIGTKGRIENFGDYKGKCSVELWDQRKDRFRLHGDATFCTTPANGTHGGADKKIVKGFIDYLRHGIVPVTSPQASRYAVAAGYAGAQSIRSGGGAVEIRPLPKELETYQF
jgi:predicted dehydrogenase